MDSAKDFIFGVGLGAVLVHMATYLEWSLLWLIPMGMIGIIVVTVWMACRQADKAKDGLIDSLRNNIEARKRKDQSMYKLVEVLKEKKDTRIEIN